MITRETDYAIRAMLCLALQGEAAVVSTTEVAETMEIPYRFLRRILRGLSAARLVASIRGKQGGLRLACDPERVALLDIIRAVDPNTVTLNICLVDDAYCNRSSICIVHEELARVQAHLNRELADVTLAALAKRERERSVEPIPT